MNDTFSFIQVLLHVLLFIAAHGQRVQSSHKRSEPRPKLLLQPMSQHAPVIKQAVETTTQLHKRKEIP